MLALVVSLWARAGAEEELLAAIREQAAASLEREPGCRHFDVTVDVEDPAHLVLYELYDDEQAFQAHRRTPHFERWSEAKARLVERQESTKARVV